MRRMKIIELSDDQATALQAKAIAQGLSLEDWFAKLAETASRPMTALDWSECPAVESVPGNSAARGSSRAHACRYPLC
jgi:hypothetical protein